MTNRKNILLALALFVSAPLWLSAQTGTPSASEMQQAGWRQGVFTAIPDALAAAAKQGGIVVVSFSSDPVADDSVPARIFASDQVRKWAADRKLTLALVEFAKAKAPDVQEARARFVQLTRQYKIAGSPTWLFLDAAGKELGRLNLEDVALADSRGDFAPECDPDFWLRQAASLLKSGRPDSLPEPVKEPTWYARFGGHGWSGKRTVSGEEGAMNYTLFEPPNLAKGRRYPLVIWLHGGVRSDGNEIADADAVRLSVAASRPGKQNFLLIPSAIGGQTWRGAPAGSGSPLPSPTMKLIERLLDTLPQSYPIDISKVVVMGESGGAFGSWALLEYYPARFAGAVINSGGGEPEKITELTSQRIWIVHGERDVIVPIQKDEEMFQALSGLRGEKPLVQNEGGWVKTSNPSDTLRFWKNRGSGHVPVFDYGAGLDWVLSSR